MFMRFLPVKFVSPYPVAAKSGTIAPPWRVPTPPNFAPHGRAVWPRRRRRTASATCRLRTRPGSDVYDMLLSGALRPTPRAEALQAHLHQRLHSGASTGADCAEAIAYLRRRKDVSFGGHDGH